MKKAISIFISFAAVIALSGCVKNFPQKNNASNSAKIKQEKTMGTNEFNQLAEPKKGEEIVLMETSKGFIKIRLFPEDAPNLVKNFKELVGKGYYNNLIFHRVIKGFMIQGGDPKGDGTGGESYIGGKMNDEISKRLKHLKGTLSMANSGPNTNGSQFFIVQAKDGTPWLDGKHSIIGQVYEGIETVDQIADVKTGKMDKPIKDIKILSIKVLTK